MKVSIEFSTDNAAFSEYPVDEIRRILTQLPDRMLQNDSGVIIDLNGNGVGEWSWERVQFLSL